MEKHNGVHLVPKAAEPRVIGRVQIEMFLVPGNPVPQVRVSGEVPGGVAGVELMLGSARVVLHHQMALQQQGGGVAVAPADFLSQIG